MLETEDFFLGELDTELLLELFLIFGLVDSGVSDSLTELADWPDFFSGDLEVAGLEDFIGDLEVAGLEDFIGDFELELFFVFVVDALDLEVLDVFLEGLGEFVGLMELSKSLATLRAKDLFFCIFIRVFKLSVTSTTFAVLFPGVW